MLCCLNKLSVLDEFMIICDYLITIEKDVKKCMVYDIVHYMLNMRFYGINYAFS